MASRDTLRDLERKVTAFFVRILLTGGMAVFVGLFWYGFAGLPVRNLVDVPLGSLRTGEVGYLATFGFLFWAIWRWPND